MGDLVKFNELDEKVLELCAKGYNRQDIALQLDIPLSEVKKVFRKPGVKEKLQEIIEYRELTIKEKSLDIVDTIIEQMLDKVEGDYTKLLGKNRDVLDVIQVAQNITKEQEKKRLGTNENNVFINILNQLSDGD